MADNSAAIARIQAILQRGVSRAVIDGRVVEYDLPALAAQLRQLKASDDTLRGQRPYASTINLGGTK